MAFLFQESSSSANEAATHTWLRVRLVNGRIAALSWASRCAVVRDSWAAIMDPIEKDSMIGPASPSR